MREKTKLDVERGVQRLLDDDGVGLLYPLVETDLYRSVFFVLCCWLVRYHFTRSKHPS